MNTYLGQQGRRRIEMESRGVKTGGGKFPLETETERGVAFLPKKEDAQIWGGNLRYSKQK